MTTYTQSKGLMPFDWNAFLSQENYTAEELDAATERAAHWPTCACGNLCDSLKVNGVPKDGILIREGFNFVGWVSCMQQYTSNGMNFNSARESAKKTLVRIEKRAAELLNKQL